MLIRVKSRLDPLFYSEKLHFAFRLTSNEKKEFREMMRELRED